MRNVSKGYIALYRQFLEWEWFTDVKTCHLFQYCLLRANSKNTVWRGISIRKGQFITSLRTMSIETGLSFQEVRTALKKLTQNLTHELTHESCASYSIITVVNYNLYQGVNTVCNTKRNKELTTDNKTNSNTSYINVSLSIEEREILEKYLLKQKRKTPIEDIDAYIRALAKNGDLKNKLGKAKQWQERQKKKEEQEKEKKKEQKLGQGIKPDEVDSEIVKQWREKARKRL